MSWNEFRNELLRRAIDELWAQWAALGVGSTDGFWPTRVDLEALLLGTLNFGRTEPRLFDEALSWCCRFGGLVNHKRLEKLLGEQSDPVTGRIARAWSDIVAKHGSANWKLKIASSSWPGPPESVFLTDELEPQATGPRRDEVFEQWGLHRGRFVPRENARPPDLSDPGLAQLFARKLIGGGGRSEVFALLLHEVEATTNELADMAVYSRRYVQDVLGDLHDAGLLDWNPGRGRTTRPMLRVQARDGFQSAMTRQAPPRNWHGLYRQRDWPGFFLGLQCLWQAVLRITQSGFEGFKAQSLLRDALEAATNYHCRTSIHAVYNPRLAADSAEELLREAQAYLDSLFVEESSAGDGRPQISGRLK
jgi:hypothetical protein